MRRLAIAWLVIVLAASIGAGWYEVSASRGLDPPAPIPPESARRIARPILSAARRDGWRIVRTARITVTTRADQTEVVEPFRFRDPPDCGAVVAIASGQLVIRDVAYNLRSLPDGSSYPVIFRHGMPPRLVMTRRLCPGELMWPDARTAERGAIGILRHTRGCNGSFCEPTSVLDEIDVKMTTLGNSTAPCTGQLELLFLRRPSEPLPAGFGETPVLDRSWIRQGPPTVSLDSGVTLGALLLALGAGLSFLVSGWVALFRRIRRRAAPQLSVRRVTLVFPRALRSAIEDEWEEAKRGASALDAIRAFRDALRARASEVRAAELECWTDGSEKARARAASMHDANKDASETYRTDASWLLVTIVVVHRTELFGYEDPFTPSGLARALGGTVPIDDDDVVDARVLFSPGSGQLATLLPGGVEIVDSAPAGAPCAACGLVVARSCPRCHGLHAVPSGHETTSQQL